MWSKVELVSEDGYDYQFASNVLGKSLNVRLDFSLTMLTANISRPLLVYTPPDAFSNRRQIHLAQRLVTHRQYVFAFCPQFDHQVGHDQGRPRKEKDVNG